MALFNENKFKVRKLDKIADKIEALAPKYSAMDDDTLASQTDVLKKRLENGENARSYSSRRLRSRERGGR